MRKPVIGLLLGAWMLAGGCIWAMAVPAAAKPAAQSPVRVINNVLAQSIVQTAKGVVIQGAIVGFRRGTVSFQSLTQLFMAEPGEYTVRLEIVDPDGKEVAYRGPFRVVASEPGWTHSELIRWQNVRLLRSGLYHFLVRVDGKVIDDFPISVTD